MDSSILSFGSLNIDHVYQLDHIVRPGETSAARSYATHPGGKGLNQSVALARAGLNVCHAGRVGRDGTWLCEVLEEATVDCRHVLRSPTEHTGHAVIQVSAQGQNSIVLYGGANRGWTDAAVAALFEKNWRAVVCQNETNGLQALLRSAKNIPVILNAAPYSEALADLNLSCLHSLLVNETEAMELAGKDNICAAFAELKARWPKLRLVMTLGENGLEASYQGRDYRMSAFPAQVLDTTAAGDTFAGYYAASILEHPDNLEAALILGSRAASLAVGRVGAAPSIPYRAELQAGHKGHKE